MITGSRYWQSWLKPALSRMNVTDWLSLLSLLTLGWLAAQVIAVTNPGPASVVKLVPYFLSGAVIIGYCYRPKYQPILGAHSGSWPLIARSIGLTFMLISLPLLALLSAQLEANNTTWLRVISVLTIVGSATIVGTLSSQLLKRWGIPLLVLTLWWILLGCGKIIENFAQAITTNDPSTQLIVLMIAIGSLGVAASLVEMTQPWLRQILSSRYSKIWSFDRPMPSFTGMGSLLIVSLLRIVRDKIFLVYIGSFIVLLLTRILVTDLLIDWLVVVELCLAGVSALVVTRLIKFSDSISKQYSHLPIGPGQVDFVGFFAGLILMASVSWIVIWGLFGVTAEVMARLIIATLSSYGAGFLVGLYSKRDKRTGVFDAFWDLLAQLLIFSFVFIYSLQLPLSGATVSLLILMLLAVTATCYQVTRTWATIKS